MQYIDSFFLNSKKNTYLSGLAMDSIIQHLSIVSNLALNIKCFIVETR